MFHDVVEIQLSSGKGGDGSASFRREKYIPRGGPDGGDGGKGGDVIIQVDKQLSDLNHLAPVRSLKAKNGTPGQGRKMDGANAEDFVVSVPVGTRVFRLIHDEWREVADLTETQQSKRLLQGGRGGLGNVHYATATNRTPRYAEPGEAGQSAAFKLELQLIADIGIIGLPNAGKSTFLSLVTQAKPKIADYPFTTLSPVLGVVMYHDERIIAADIPGLIEGASEGKGLGHTFLRHIERTHMLIHFIDALSTDYAGDYLKIRRELGNFDPQLLAKPEMVVITKAELITPDIQSAFDSQVKALKKAIRPPSVLFSQVTISAVTKKHINELLGEIVPIVTRIEPQKDLTETKP